MKRKVFSLLLALVMVVSMTAVVSAKTAKPGQVKNLKVTVAADYSSAALQWNKVSGAKGYKVYKQVGDEKFVVVKTIKKAKTVKFTDTELKAAASYKVRAYKTVKGKTVYGKYSKVVTADPAAAILAELEKVAGDLINDYSSMIKTYAPTKAAAKSLIDSMFDSTIKPAIQKVYPNYKDSDKALIDQYIEKKLDQIYG